ncbi:MAG: OpgC domain-containing protein [Anaerolineales bacterium]
MSLPTLLFLLPGGTSSSAGKLLLWSNYPALQWMELVIFGIVFGRWLVEDPRKAFGRAWKFGMAFLMAFIMVRYFDGFGNIRPRLSDSWFDFLNPVKYPPSLTFTLMTTGANLFILWLFSRAGEWAHRVMQPLAVFGQVPLFFYVLHLFLYAALGYWLTPGGTSILAMYPLWLLGLLILFPLCLWYRQFKHRQPLRSVLQYL